MKNQQCSHHLPEYLAEQSSLEGCDSSEVFLSENYITHEQAEAIINTFIQLKKLLEATLTAGDDPLSIEEVIGERDETASELELEREGYNLKLNAPCTSNQELECLHKEVVSETTDMTVDLLENVSVIGNFKADSMMNEEKVNAPQDCKWE